MLCAKCKQEKESYKNQLYCKDCQKEYATAYYQENKAVYRARNNAIKERNRNYIHEHLLAHPCVDCGESDPVVLTFDHVRGSKAFDIASVPAAMYSLEKIQTELDKCEVRCANCHARKTAKQFGWKKMLL